MIAMPQGGNTFDHGPATRWLAQDLGNCGRAPVDLDFGVQGLGANRPASDARGVLLFFRAFLQACFTLSVRQTAVARVPRPEAGRGERQT
jgi:hypothetical protein